MNFDSLAERIRSNGPAAAVDELIVALRTAEDYHALFYALLMKARVSLGVSPFPTGASADLPSDVHEAYEEAIRSAAREVGSAHLAKGDLPRAWGFYRLIQEPQPVRAALQSHVPGPEDDIYPLLDIAWYQRVHPQRGFELLLERHGICSAITTLGSTDLSSEPNLRIDCIRKLLAALHAQLVDRLSYDLSQRNLAIPATVPAMLRAELFEDDASHIDASHLASVVQMSLELPPQDVALLQARDLSEYGERLGASLRGSGDPPFENLYADYSQFLRILAGEQVEAGLSHFESKIASEMDDGNSFPAEVFINLLLRLERLPEAVAAAKKYFSALPADAALSCPNIVELARRAGDYSLVAEAARSQGDAVTFLAGLIAATVKNP